MLSNEELKQAYQEAYDAEFVSDLETGECPASAACKQLSEGGDYNKWKENYAK